MSALQGLEMVRCAMVNLHNLATLVPGLHVHPFYKIVEEQLKQAEQELEEEEQ